MGGVNRGSKGSRTNKIRKSVTKKRQYHPPDPKKVTERTSAVSRKLKSSDSLDVDYNNTVDYAFIAFTQFFLALSTFVKCKECNKDITFSKTCEKGLGFQVSLQCDCKRRVIDSCARIGTDYEINRKFIFVMRLIGVGIRGVKLFCSLMDLCHDFTNYSYYSTVNNIQIATKTIYDMVIERAGQEEKKLLKDKGLPQNHFTVSGDGTWAKRGFSSLVGISTLIGKYSGKLLDLFVSSKSCQTCDHHRKKMSPSEFLIWFESEHADECSVNYQGSSGGMEVQGVVEMFKRSEELHDAKYSHYIGDGDSKTFKNLVDSNPYVDLIVTKLYYMSVSACFVD